MDGKPDLYTLDEARRILCAEWGGHELETVEARIASGKIVQTAIYCTRCDTTFVPQEPE